MHHFLKVHAQIYPRLKSGEMRFEVRRDDRCYQTGDKVTLMIHRDDGTTNLHGENEPLDFRIGFILRGGQYGVEHGYVVFQLEDIPESLDGIADCLDEDPLPLRTPDGWRTHDGSNIPNAVRGLSFVEVRFRDGREETLNSVSLVYEKPWQWDRPARKERLNGDIIAYRIPTAPAPVGPEYPKGWQDHDGKAVPEWVRPNFCVDVQLRDGRTFRQNFPNDLSWIWKEAPFDVVAYKIV